MSGAAADTVDDMDKEPYRWALTTSMKAGQAPQETAAALAELWRVPYLPRLGRSLRELRLSHHIDYLVSVDSAQRVYLEEPLFRWHPSMAIPRFRRLSEGGGDLLLSAAELEEGDAFLDCTLGLGADALLAAWAVGDAGGVLGLEASPIVALISGWGLRYEAPGLDRKKAPMKAAAGRITVLAEEALHFLTDQPDDSWDVVYFDPMFQTPNHRSDGVNSLRPLACYAPFTAKVLGEALRVCRKRVLLKERSFSSLFKKLGAHRILTTKYGPVAYGIWEKTG